MNKYDIMYNSIQKNIQELCEFLVDETGATGYYDLVDYIYTLKENSILLYKLFDKLQCDIADNKRFMEYLIKCGFTEKDINRIMK